MRKIIQFAASCRFQNPIVGSKSIQFSPKEQKLYKEFSISPLNATKINK